MKIKEKEDGSIKIPKKCPGCGNHCPADKLKCGKGRKIFAAYRKKMEEAAGKKAVGKAEEVKGKKEKREERKPDQDVKAAVLNMLSDGQPRKPKEIRKALKLEKKELYKLLSGLEKNGLITIKGEKPRIFLAGQTAEDKKKDKKRGKDKSDHDEKRHDKHDRGESCRDKHDHDEHRRDKHDRDGHCRDKHDRDEHHHDKHHGAIHYEALSGEEKALLKKLLKKLIRESEAVKEEKEIKAAEEMASESRAAEHLPEENKTEETRTEEPKAEEPRPAENPAVENKAEEDLTAVSRAAENGTAEQQDADTGKKVSEYPEDWQDWI